MIGIVAVSHSARLAEAAIELAGQMVPGEGAPVRAAAGAGSDPEGAPILGTDATAVAAAIDELAEQTEGVLVLMDLGSAVMSAELALELRTSEVPVRLVPAPFVEGLLAATVTASTGGTLDQAADEARRALQAKNGQLEETGPVGQGAAEPPAEAPVPAAPGTRIVTVRNPQGMHARPAALIAEAAAGADVRVRRLPDGPESPAASMMRLLVLGARQGDEVELSGTDEAALDRVASLFDDGFGELDGSAPAAQAGAASEPPAPPAAPSSPQETSPLAAGSALTGRGVSAGRVVAPVVLLAPALSEPSAQPSIAEGERDAEAARIQTAASAVAAQLRARAEAATGEPKAILEATTAMAEDPELAASAVERVRSTGITAARAVWEASAEQTDALAALGGRMAERVADVRDVRDRIIAQLLGAELPGVPDRAEPFVLAATDLAPADAAGLGASACVALVTEQGGPTSHTAIIARALGIPAVVGAAGATRIPSGTTVLVDGTSGAVQLDPSDEQVALAAAEADIPAFDGRGRLSDGQAVTLLGNVGGAADAQAAAEARAEGVGLFRTEFCFLDRQDAPTVVEQVAAYRAVLAPFSGKRVVVRTLDAGSDKPLPFATAEHEENPALGVRGLRVAQGNPELLADQLSAIAVAAKAENARVDVMAPMVATVDEARAFAEACRRAGIARSGVMIETPAAALLAAEILDVVDFVSLGTNDLAQYTMAADRLSAELGDLNDPWQPAVLRLIRLVGDAGRAAERSVGVCGEAGGDASLAPVLVGLGVTSLSMTPRALDRVADALARVSIDDCRRAAEAAVSAPTADAARAAAREALEAASS
ncbi:hypothetical protein GCM10025768_20870 [Microbacterium pseudoresistens]|uniref:Phosphocarrier protein HPr n=1 Tax=Microbacterium pseudoresistens TaxID=640634 RepID=A0A7Y9ESZ4_9MICO|nr:phosphoenolpyruvate--protein phosphotransferase [Microbacterium pseudoresistens]NYD53384.1 phosphotransferase system enzyme I (PtsI) [Microbacterium pseudoresistens]